jgi:NADH/NAD ratio-sensing transcriptional regulator Rex
MSRKIQTKISIEKATRISEYFIGETNIGKAIVNYSMEGANNVSIFSSGGELIGTTDSQVKARQFLADKYHSTEVEVSV